MTRILLSNDDGYAAPGLTAAYEALQELGEVTVVAPTQQKSGASHSLTLEEPLRARPLPGDRPGYMVDFTPVDCVKLALNELLPEPPDLVVSGVNRGSNAGHLVHYSGTVGAAIEAVLHGIPAVAFSLCQYASPDFTAARHVVRNVTAQLLAHPLPPRTLLNVNIPPRSHAEIAGYRWCRQSLATLGDEYDRREDPRGHPYFWLTGTIDGIQGAHDDDDLRNIRAGYVTLTPLRIDWTDEDLWQSGGGALMDGLQGEARS